MPAIKQYEAPQLGLQPSEKGVDAQAAAGRLIGRFYNQAGEDMRQAGADIGGGIKAAGDAAVQYVEHREISHGAASYAQLNDDLTNGWNDAAKKADPNDPSVAAKFREETLEPALQKYQQAFQTEGGQKWAEARVDALRNHFFTKTAADMSTLAGDAVSVNYGKTKNSLSNTAMNDPSAVPHLLDSADGLVGGMVESAPNIKGADSSRVRMQLTEKMKEAIVKSGAIGAINKAADPEAEAQKWGQQYPQYISGDELKTLGTTAKTINRANLAAEKQAQTYQQQLNKHEAEASLSKIWTDNVSFDADGKVAIKPGLYRSVLDVEQKYPGAATERAKTMINWAQSQTKEKRETIVTDKAVQTQLLDGLFNPDHPTTDIDILKAQAENKLDAHASTSLMQLQKAMEDSPLKGPIYQSTMAAVKGILGDSEKGLDAYAKFMQSFLPDYISQKRAGTLPANALDLRDDNSLISQSLNPWKLTPQEKMMGHLMKNLGIGADPGSIIPLLNGSVNPHSDLNLFSSGRAQQMGIKGGIGQNMVPLTAGGQTIQVNEGAAPHFKSFIDELQARGYHISDIGGFSPRNKSAKSGAPNEPSEHAYGNAIDINASRNPQGGNTSDMPSDVGQIAAKHGLIWGGNWSGSSRDPMHFEWSGNGGTPTRTAGAPEIGTVMQGFRFKGGDPSKQDNWTKAN